MPTEEYADMDMDEASDLYRLGRECMERKDFTAAAELLEKSATLSPHFKTLELLGECRMQSGMLREAVIPLAAATALNDQSRAPALLSKVLWQLGDREGAVRLARVALARSPSNKTAAEVLRNIDLGSN